MKTLRVRLDYQQPDQQLGQAGQAGVALPLKVVDVQGTILVEAVALSSEPTDIELTGDYHRVFVRLAWPSGRTETQVVNLSAQPISEVKFSDSGFSRNEWLSWAVPRLNPRSQLAERDRPISLDIRPYTKVWLRLWRFENSGWSSMPMAANNPKRNDVARQIDLVLEAYPHMLQIGGSNVPWRLVSLPAAGRCRVLLTPNESVDPRADALKVVITGFRNDAETLLEFLARDSIRAATTMAKSETIASELFAEKFRDPLAAVAAGYYLLRVERWEQIPLSWWANLSKHFAWIPDTSILHSVRLLRAGLSGTEAQRQALNLFKLSLDRGWPVYEEGLHLLLEAGSLLRNIAAQGDAPYFARVDTLATAKSWAGAALSFYGLEPSKPSAVLWVGMPKARRRHRLASHEWKDRLTNLESTESREHRGLTTPSTIRQLRSSSFAEEFARKPQGRVVESSSSRSPRTNEMILPMGKVYVVIDRPAEAENASKRQDWILLGDIDG
jgi:hypothetical protein